jgi:multidrug efflux pump subunit AcrA (membrane-fusion protein)
MEKKKRSIWKKVLAFILFVALVAGLASLPLLTESTEEETQQASILSDTAQYRTIDETISAAGYLETPEYESAEIPSGVTVTELLVQNGDYVTAGQAIAKVDQVSVMNAVLEVQDTLDTLQESIRSKSSSISSGAVWVDEDGTMYVGSSKIADSKLADYAEYISLTAQHEEYEALLLELFKLNQSGTVTAPCDGIVDSLDTSLVVSTSSGDNGSVHISLLAVNTPSGNGEEDDGITYSAAVGVINSIDEDTGSWDLLMNPAYFSVADFRNTGADTTITSMTEEATRSAGTVFVFSGEEWSVVQEIKPGDILLFAYGDDGSQWIIKLGSTSEQIEEPTDPTFPGGDSGDSGFSGGGFSGGSFSGGTQSSASDESSYSLSEMVVCNVLPMDTITITATVDESDITKIDVGMEASITLYALPDQELTAAVTEISKFGSSSGGSSKFTITLELPYAENLLPGMNGSVVFTTNSNENVLSVPVAALVDQGTKSVIYTALDEKTGALTAPVEVELGVSDGTYVQILSGLDVDDEIFYSYYDTLDLPEELKNI